MNAELTDDELTDDEIMNDELLDKLTDAVRRLDFEEVGDILDDYPELDVNKPDSCGEFALVLAAEEDCFLKSSRALVEHGADVNVMNVCRVSPLCMAVQGGDLSTVEFFLAKGADINNEGGQNPLVTAVEEKDRDMINLLVKRGADLDKVDPIEMSPLMEASRKGYLKIADSLLNSGAGIDLQNKFGETALGFAAKNNHKDVVKLLLERGAKIVQEGVLEKISGFEDPEIVCLLNKRTESVKNEIIQKMGSLATPSTSDPGSKLADPSLARDTTKIFLSTR